MLRKLFLTLAIITFVFAFLPVRMVQAAGFAVDSSGDEPDTNPGDGVCLTASQTCTLRAALQEADWLSGDDVITVPAMTILVGSELVYNGSTDGSLEIDGAGQGQTILDGQNLTRIFLLRPQQAGKITMRDLTIQNGKDIRTYNDTGVDRPGASGGIYIEGILDLYNIDLLNNMAQVGGGLYVDYGVKPTVANPNPYHATVHLYNVTIQNNTAITALFGIGGGGVFNGSELYADRVDISNNVTTIQQGAGLFNNTWYWAELHNFKVNNNTAKSDGGGIDNDLGEVRLFDGTLEGNHVQCCRSDGTAPGGAGILNYGIPIGLANAHLTRVLVKDNVNEGVGAPGGGITNIGKMTLDQVSVVGNKASYGAGIYNGDADQPDSTLVITNSTISNNEGINGTNPRLDSEAGALMLRFGTVSIYNSTITQNTAVGVGGISTHLAAASASLTIYNTILAQNVSAVDQDCWGTILSGDNNLVGRPKADNGGYYCSFAAKAHDLTYIDPDLLPQVTNFLIYFPLSAISPAIDSANLANCPPVDEIGVERPQGNGCDMGAIEYYQVTLNLQNSVFIPDVFK